MKTKFNSIALAVSLLAAGSLSSYADVLTLKDGSTLTGKYSGGTESTVVFQTSIGTQTIQTDKIASLSFSSTAATTAAPAPPTAAAPPKSVTVPAGTTLLVRMVDTVSSKSKPGAKFTTKLEYDLVIGGGVAVKAGTPIYGKVVSASQARRAVGQSTLQLQLNQIAPGGSPIAISTSDFKEAGDASIKKAARGAAAGAAIGAIADDNGAGKGAAIGATAGALRKGETVTIPPGTLLEFDLTQSVTVNP